MICKDCIHYEVCGNKLETKEQSRHNDNYICCNFKNKSLFIELPCKIGDVVYVIENKRPCYACAHCTDFCHMVCPFPDRLEKVVKEATIIKILITQNMTIEIFVEVSGTDNIFAYSSLYSSTDFDKTIFFSEEKAEKALKEREQNDR